MEALHSLKSTEPQQWLTPSVTLSQTARMASQHLFSCLKPHTPNSPFEKLLVEGFDAEQIWQQIDIASQPLISSLKRKVMKLEKNPEGIKLVVERKSERKQLDDDDEGDVDDDVEEEGESEDDDDDDDVDDEVDEEGGSEEKEGKGGIEDKFLKIKELEAYLEDDEAKEYGDLNNSKDDDVNKKNRKRSNELDDEEEEDDDDEEEEEEEDVDDEDEEDNYVDDDDADELGNAKYEDFFGAKKKTTSKGKLNVVRKDSSSDDEEMDEKQGGPSTHEKQLEKLRSEIEQMEKANLEPKNWTMRGEVTATSRPKNSALEVDLDFEHNVRPAPVITEEVTASLEDMIQSRIIEGRFDDVQKLPSLPSTTQREVKEMDENKSKKGLAEVYEEEYIQKTNLAAAPISFSDEQKKEAAILFKKLCLKLDALSHFHFAPKPAIEEMSIQANVPALAMEEIAPLAVSDASMLAPEEVFSGKGDIKEDAELTQAERKRRRAKKKRKFKAEGMKRMAKRARQIPHC